MAAAVLFFYERDTLRNARNLKLMKIYEWWRIDHFLCLFCILKNIFIFTHRFSWCAHAILFSPTYYILYAHTHKHILWHIGKLPQHQYALWRFKSLISTSQAITMWEFGTVYPVLAPSQLNLFINGIGSE